MFVELTEAGQRLAAKWVDPTEEHGRVWISLSKGKSVPELVIWPAWEAEVSYWRTALREERTAGRTEDAEETLRTLDELREFGEALFAAVGMPSILRRVVSWLEMGGKVPSPVGCLRCSSVEEHTVAAAFGPSTSAVWCGQLAPVREAARHMDWPPVGSWGTDPKARGYVVSQLRQAASQLEDEARLEELLGELGETSHWSPDVHRTAWWAAGLASRMEGWAVHVLHTPDGLRMVFRQQLQLDVPEWHTTHRWVDVASLPIRAGVDSGGFRSGPPDVRGLVAELAALGATDTPEVAQRREQLAVRLWRTVQGVDPDLWGESAPVAGHQWDHCTDPDQLVLVVQLPDGPAVRTRVRTDALSARELAGSPEMAGVAESATPEELAAWLARTA